MKVLLSDTTYSYLFPGGKQVHAQKLFINLKNNGVDVEYENWHNPNLKGDIVQFFGFNDFEKITTLKKRGYKLVYTHILDGVTNQSRAKKFYHLSKNKIVNILPEKLNPLFPWRALKYFDALIYMHENDRKTAINLYNVDPKKAFVVPHAVDSLEKFIPSFHDDKYLISLGSIVPRKNALMTADLCIKNNIPVIFVGHPFDSQSEYFKEFLKRVDGKLIKYCGYVAEDDKIKLLNNASGFVLLSLGESGCISIYEAAAAGLPLLLSDLPWAKGYEDPVNISYCNVRNYDEANKSIVKFYSEAKRTSFPSFKVNTWEEIAKKYATIYRSLLVH